MEHKFLSLDNVMERSHDSGGVSGHTQSLSGYNQERATSQHSSAFSGSEFFLWAKKEQTFINQAQAQSGLWSCLVVS